ncbi:hypothetical protein [Polaromonas sp. DSR2-3-2]|uniref:hypothetical protein n=1 Tax=unclassified Polaromonas TaxID=2638319 RepID=UPI003CEED277
MNAKTRLDKVRSQLEQSGVRDVKFFLAKGVCDKSCADVAGKVADFLEGYLNGSFRKVDSFGDYPKAA